MSTYTIQIDNKDREECPDKPWTANILDEEGETITDAGLGRTPLEALNDALKDDVTGALAFSLGLPAR